MDKKQKLLRLLKLEEIIQDGDTAIAKFLFNLEDKLDEVYNNIDEIQKEQGEPGADGHTPTEEELLELIKPLIPEVENGKTPTKDELIALIKPLIPQVKDGKTPSKSELLEIIKPLIPKIDEDSIIQKAVKIVQDSIALPSVDELIDNVEKRLPKLSEPIRDALELLQDENRLDAKHIHGLDTYYNDTFKTFARKEDVHVISTNKPLSEMVDVNVQGLKVGQSLNWNGREWTPYFPTDKAIWGSISGTLTDQTDLVDALNLKYDASNPDGFISEESDTLQSVTDRGATTTNDITANAFIGDGSQLTDLPLGDYWKSDGSSTATGNWDLGDNKLFTDGGIQVGTTTDTEANFYISNVKTGTDDISIGNLTLSSRSTGMIIEASPTKSGSDLIRPSIRQFNGRNDNQPLAFSLFRVYTGSNDTYDADNGAIFGAYASEGGDNFQYLYFGVNEKAGAFDNILRIYGSSIRAYAPLRIEDAGARFDTPEGSIGLGSGSHVGWLDMNFRNAGDMATWYNDLNVNTAGWQFRGHTGGTGFDTKFSVDADGNVDVVGDLDVGGMTTTEQVRTTGDVAITYDGDFTDTVTVGTRDVVFTNDGTEYTKWEDDDFIWTPAYSDGKIISITKTNK